jgi:hypothetical protein
MKTLILFVLLSTLTFGQELILFDELSAPYGQELFRLVDSTTYLKTNDGEVFTTNNPLISYLEKNNEENNYALLTDDRYWVKPKFLSIHTFW